MLKRLIPFAVVSAIGFQAFGAPANVVLDERTRREGLVGEIASERFQAQMDVLSDSTRVAGNQAQLLISGQQSYPVRFKLIDDATKSIIISTFSIYSGQENGDIGDETTRILVEKLIDAKQRRGVDVRVVVDGGTSVLAQSTLALQKLRDGGIKVIKYNPIVSKKQDAPLLVSILPGASKLLQGYEPIEARWHEKTMVIDGKYVITGGLNWGEIYGKPNALVSSAYSPLEFSNRELIREVGVQPIAAWGDGSPTAWRDTDVLVKGPIAAEVSKKLLRDFALLDIMNAKPGPKKYMDATDEDYASAAAVFDSEYKNNPKFFHDWSRESLPRNSGTMRYISQRPKIDRKRTESAKPLVEYAQQNELFVEQSNPHLYMTNFYVNAINKAQKQILWGCHSNRPTDEMLNALRAAAKRGVKIIIVGNSPESARNLPDFGTLMYPLALCHYRNLLSDADGNVRIFEWQKSVERDGQTLTAGAFHSKVFSIDGVLTSVGSYNMSKASWGKHTEGTIVVTDPDFARSAEQMFQTDLGFSKELRLEELSDSRCQVPGLKFIMGPNHMRKTIPLED
ncbi:MAG TPA: phosphatidylserine/phosphatidylglycerophosphate/cardiolipin synthase family protein [Bdellovibrionales bacterium]|nr:phosphatidylserine/phosphatidylglycerophosphate/cardiolipin synthase family protein [Bdellovibrionales bacterium]